MNKDNKQIKQKPDDWSDIDRMTGKLSVSWDEPKEEIWQRMAPQLAQPAFRPTRILWMRPAFRLAVAAVLVLLMATGTFIRFYRVSVETGAGQQQLVTLPDGSTIQLNAGSSLNYHPYWWTFSRELAFNGEGYFEVEKGRRFSVVSAKGTTSVLGTSFTVFARETTYRVACLTGKVKVVDAGGQHEVVLEPNQKVAWQEGGFLKTEAKPAEETAWTRNQFLFTGTPIHEVFEEIERQYGVQISHSLLPDFEYAGNFSRELLVEEVLNYVCKPFNLKFEKLGSKQYRVIKKE